MINLDSFRRGVPKFLKWFCLGQSAPILLRYTIYTYALLEFWAHSGLQLPSIYWVSPIT